MHAAGVILRETDGVLLPWCCGARLQVAVARPVVGSACSSSFENEDARIAGLVDA